MPSFCEDVRLPLMTLITYIQSMKLPGIQEDVHIS